VERRGSADGTLGHVDVLAHTWASPAQPHADPQGHSIARVRDVPSRSEVTRIALPQIARAKIAAVELEAHYGVGSSPIAGPWRGSC